MYIPFFYLWGHCFMLYFLSTQLLSIVLLTWLGNYTLWLVFFILLLCVAWFYKKWSLLIGFLVGWLFLVRFEYMQDSFVREPNQSLQWVIVWVRSLQSYEVATDDGIILIRTFPRETPLWLWKEIYATIRTTTPAQWVQYSRWWFDLHSVINQQFDFSKRLWMKGYKGSYNVGRVEELWDKQFFVRDRIAQTIVDRYGYTKEWALLQGMLLGWRVWMSDDHYQTFIDSWLVHIIAVSWKHILMLLITLQYLLFFIPVWWRRALSICIVIWYLFICGLDSSTVRATIMALIKIIIIFRWAKISFSRLITYTCTLLLFFNPYFLLFDVWFLLSMSAVLGIRFVIVHFQSVHKSLIEYLLIPIFAFLGVLPILILFMGSLNILSFLTTLVIGPFLLPLLLVSVVSLFVNYGPLVQLWQRWLDLVYLISQRWQGLGVYMTINSFGLSFLVVMSYLLCRYWFAVYKKNQMSIVASSITRM